MFVTHAFSNLVGSLFVGQQCQQLIGVWEGGGRTFSSGDDAVDGNEVGSVLGTGILQRLFEAGLAGGLFAVEQSKLV